MLGQEIATIIVEAEADRRLVEALIGNETDAERQFLCAESARVARACEEPEPSPLSRALTEMLWDARGWR